MNKVILGLIFAFFASVAMAADNIPEREFVDANSFYRQGKYQEAIAKYEYMLNLNVESAAIYYNLGNSYFKNKQLGKAIVNYSRAQRIMPRDGDLAVNYKFASDRVVPQIKSNVSLLDNIIRPLINYLSLNEMILILFIFMFVFGVLHLAGLYSSWQPNRFLIMFFVILFMIFSYGFVLKLNLEKNQGVIIKAAMARFEPNDKATVYFDLPEGQIVKWQIKEGEWLRIERPDGKIGWVPREAFEDI